MLENTCYDNLTKKTNLVLIRSHGGDHVPGVRLAREVCVGRGGKAEGRTGEAWGAGFAQQILPLSGLLVAEGGMVDIGERQTLPERKCKSHEAGPLAQGSVASVTGLGKASSSCRPCPVRRSGNGSAHESSRLPTSLSSVTVLRRSVAHSSTACAMVCTAAMKFTNFEGHGAILDLVPSATTLPHGGPGEERCGGFGKVVFLRSNTLTKMLPWDLLDIRRMLVVPESFFTICPSRERPLWPRYCSAQVEQPPMLSASAPLLQLPPWPARSGGSGITALR